MSDEFYSSLPVIVVPVGSTSSVIEFHATEDDADLDLSSATGDLLFYAKTFGETQVVDGATATWTTDGSDGKVRITSTSELVGTIRDMICDFEVQGYGSGNLILGPFILRVAGRGKVV